VTLNLTPGAPARGGLTLAPADPSAPRETLRDDASIAGIASANAASSDVRLIYQTAPLAQSVRISGTPTVDLRMSSSRQRANLTAALVSYVPSGGATILTRGWLDPANRNSDWADVPLKAGSFYPLEFDMQPKDTVVPAGNRLALMVLSSDRDFTIRPAPGTQLTLDLARSSLSLPVVGGSAALAEAMP
jgi:predicted acyl esterase